MGAVYTRTAAGDALFAVAEAKTYLKIPSGVTADDTLITSMITACTEYAEGYSGRCLRASQTWEALFDEFDNPLELRKSKVAYNGITKIEHLVSGAWVTVNAATYYVKLGRWWPEIYLVDGYDWPTNTDTHEQCVKVTFATTVWDDLDTAKLGVKRHIAHLYENRGDNDERALVDLASAARLSGANAVYDLFSIPRVP